MSEHKHTNGPWTYGQYFGTGVPVFYVRGPNDEKIVQGTTLINEANARLIAAAPDLLVGARRAYNFMLNTQREHGIADDSEQEFETTKLLRSAIAKATGR